VIVVDEYLALDVLRGQWPEGLPEDDLLGLPVTHHYRLLQRVHQPGTGRLSRILAGLSDAGRDAVRRPHPDIVQVLDPRPLIDQAASIGARYRTGGLLMTETLAAGLAHRRALYFGSEDNVGRRFAEIAADLGIAITVLAS
jgi:hypothetical protein